MPSMGTDPVVVSTLLGELILRQLSCGRWAALASWATLLPSSIRLGQPRNSGESFSLGSGVPISSGNWGVAVIVAVRCLTSPTFQAFTGVPLCAH